VLRRNEARACPEGEQRESDPADFSTSYLKGISLIIIVNKNKKRDYFALLVMT